MTMLPGLLGPHSFQKAMRRKGVVKQVLVADGGDFETRPVAQLDLDLQGIAGDRHYGATRPAGAREPWYPRGTIIRNERILSLVAPDDLSAIAHAMAVAAVRPEWLGANAVIDGVPHFSFLPPGSRLFFEGGAVLAITAQNKPCRYAGAAVARHVPDSAGLDLLFTEKAQGLRGLVATIERPGAIRPDMAVDIRIPEQWIYDG